MVKQVKKLQVWEIPAKLPFKEKVFLLILLTINYPK
jgi:hypothetical protein